VRAHHHLAAVLCSRTPARDPRCCLRRPLTIHGRHRQTLPPTWWLHHSPSGLCPPTPSVRSTHHVVVQPLVATQKQDGDEPRCV
jgi:hypothetical protein